MNRFVLPAVITLSLLAACEKSPDPSSPATAADSHQPPDANYTRADQPDDASVPQDAATDLVTHDLEGTRWVPVQLAGNAVVLDENQREQYVVLESAQRRVAGNAGCNRLLGSYELNGDAVAFSQLATTRMACPGVEREAALLHALESAATWRITGAHLELFDASGAALATFEARNL